MGCGQKIPSSWRACLHPQCHRSPHRHYPDSDRIKDLYSNQQSGKVTSFVRAIIATGLHMPQKTVDLGGLLISNTRHVNCILFCQKKSFCCQGQIWVAYKFTLAGHAGPVTFLLRLVLFAVIFGHFSALLLHSLSLQLLLLLSVHLFKALADPCR